MQPQLRPAKLDDLSAIRAIFNEVISNSTAIYEDNLRSETEIRAWFDQRTQNGYPIFVCELDGKVIGMGFYGPFRGATGYKTTVEHGLHLTPEMRGKGHGQLIMQHLIDHARESGFHVMVAAIDAVNVGSIRLHEKFGFKTVAQMPEVARKFDRWLELVLMQLIL